MENDDDELTTADEVRELQAALDKALDENKRLREEIKALRLIYPEGTADRLTVLELENKRLRTTAQ